MPKATATCNDILALILNATPWANFADNAAAAPNTQLHLALHTADPGVGGAQTTNETAYTNYARQATARSTSGWTAPAAGASQNAALIQFPQCGATGATLTHVSLGKNGSGAGRVLYAGALNSPIAVSNLIQPQFAVGAITITET